MEKYRKKSNSSTMDNSQSQGSHLGVCTRSRALALCVKQRSVAGEDSGGLYIQLRNWRLEKKLKNRDSKRQRRQRGGNGSPNPNSTPNSKLRGNSVEKEEEKIVVDADADAVDSSIEGVDDGVHSPIEGSFGGNLLENEGEGEGER